MSTTVELKVGMTCDGCAKLVTNVLNKVPGVSGVKCDVPNQRVTVTGTSLKEEDIVNTVTKTGKTVSVIH